MSAKPTHSGTPPPSFLASEMSSTLASDDPIRQHLRAAFARADTSRREARRLLVAGFPAPAFVWAVRSAEMFMRDFVLTPHFIETGSPWSKAMQQGSKILGSSNWSKAFAIVEEWYGPFDEPLLEDGSTNAWSFWETCLVRVRGDLVHGRAVQDPSPEEVEGVLAFVERMASWYPQRFLASSKHPISRMFFELLHQLDTHPDVVALRSSVAP